MTKIVNVVCERPLSSIALPPRRFSHFRRVLLTMSRKKFETVVVLVIIFVISMGWVPAIVWFLQGMI